MTENEHYPESFYATRNARSKASADTILALALEYLPPIESVVDYGCGVGTWLASAKALGVARVHGYEGRWLDPELLEIERDEFSFADFAERIAPEDGTAADLAISLEVAEHLPSACADEFVALLARSADFVLFSAAIPGQGGKGHVNGQWPEYWISRFEARGFVAFDALRPRIWADTRIRPWYRQNVLLFVRRERIAETSLDVHDPKLAPRALVHPSIYEAVLAKERARLAEQTSVAGAWRNLRRALFNRTPRG